MPVDGGRGAHVAEFGRDEELLVLLAGALERRPAPPVLRRRFAELCERP